MSRNQRPNSWLSAISRRRRIADFLLTKTRKGERCAECGTTFTVDRGDGKVMAIFDNGCPGGGLAFYVLCDNCGSRYKSLGPAALPTVQRDWKLTVAMSPFNPANAAAFKSVH